MASQLLDVLETKPQKPSMGYNDDRTQRGKNIAAAPDGWINKLSLPHMVNRKVQDALTQPPFSLLPSLA